MRGFTLIETIIYIGLFGLMFTGIFTSMYPILTNAERMSKNIVTEGETAYILGKIRYALAKGMTSDARSITTTGNTIVVSEGSTELFRFEEDGSGTFCTPPRACSMIVYSENGDDPTPLNAERVYIDNFEVTHTLPSGNVPRIIEIAFTTNEVEVGPIRYYLHF